VTALGDRSELLRAVGVGVSLPTLAVATGLIVFLALVHRGPRREVFALTRLAHWSASLAVLGAVAEIGGIAELFGERWTDALTDGHASAGMLRLFGAALIVVGLFEPPITRPVGVDVVRWVPGGAAVFAVVGALMGVLSYNFDGHTVSRGPRLVHCGFDIVHVAAGSVWAGGVVALVVVALIRRRAAAGGPVAPLAHAFGRVAAIALAAVAVAGVVMSAFVVAELDDYVDTTWGRRLLVKLAAVAVAAALGGYHHFVAIPRHHHGDSAALRRSLGAEAVALVGVLVLTTFLVRASPN
jgi:copper transport protein